MQRYIAFLRGVNLGKRRLPITQLRDSFEEVGFDDVETFIASGGQGAPITDLDNAEFDGASENWSRDTSIESHDTS